MFPASQINRHVGARIQLRRIRLGMSREQLAGVVGVRAAEMELYEEGIAKVPANLLVDLAEALSVPISYFFVGPQSNRPLADEASPGSES